MAASEKPARQARIEERGAGDEFEKGAKTNAPALALLWVNPQMRSAAYWVETAATVVEPVSTRTRAVTAI